MNLYLNLLQNNERQRPEGIVMMSLFHVGCVVVVCLMLGLIAWVNMRHNAIVREINDATAERQNLDKDFKMAQSLQAESQSLLHFFDELAYFTNSQQQVAARLERLAELVPESVQLTDLNWQQQTASAATSDLRRVTLRLSGRAVGGDEADIVVRDFIEALDKAPPPADFGKVSPGSFAVAPLGESGVQAYNFEINVAFNTGNRNK